MSRLIDGPAHGLIECSSIPTAFVLRVVWLDRDDKCESTSWLFCWLLRVRPLPIVQLNWRSSLLSVPYSFVSEARELHVLMVISTDTPSFGGSLN